TVGCVSLEAFSEVVEAIYDCALDPNRWHAMIREIAKILKSQGCALGVHDYETNRNELAFRLGYEPDAYWQAHEERYSRLSPFWAPLQITPLGTVRTRAMLVDDDEFFESRYYQEWVKPQGLDDAIT